MTTAPAPIETSSPITALTPGPPRMTASAPARNRWPMVSVPPPGELIVTCRPVWAIEPIVIGWPSSARIELARPMLWATRAAGSR